MAAPSGVGLAMKFFGKKNGQSLVEFRNEWQALSDESKIQLAAGLVDGTLTY